MFMVLVIIAIIIINISYSNIKNQALISIQLKSFFIFKQLWLNSC